MIATAPGKLVLLGEYAVVESGRAIVAAVNRRARGWRTDTPPGPSPFVQAVLDRCDAPVGVEIDTGAMSQGGDKLGVGSSAAVSVLTAGLVTGRCDVSVRDIAIDAHRAASGGVGSGIDVAASFHGGVIAAARQPAPVQHLSALPESLNMGVLYTGQSASTRAFVRACKACPQWSAHVERLAARSRDGIDAWAAGDADGLLRVVRAYGLAMADLGADAGVPIVTPVIEAIMRAADGCGAAAKPSGAGGGDVAIVFATDPDVPALVARQTGAALIDIQIDPLGLQLEDTAAER